MNRSLFLIFVYFLASIFNVYSMSVYEAPAPQGYEERKKLQFEIVEKVNEKLEKKYDMISSAIGSSGDRGFLKGLDISFDRYNGPVSLEENRNMILDCLQIYLDAVNSNEKIRPYLASYPFTSQNFDIFIIHYEKDGSMIFHPHVGALYCYSKGIAYYTNDPEKEYKYKNEIKETYEEAYSKLKETKQNQTKQSESTET